MIVGVTLNRVYMQRRKILLDRSHIYVSHLRTLRPWMDPWLGMLPHASGSGLCRESLMRFINTERVFWYTILTYSFAAVSSLECDLSLLPSEPNSLAE